MVDIHRDNLLQKLHN